MCVLYFIEDNYFLGLLFLSTDSHVTIVSLQSRLGTLSKLQVFYLVSSSLTITIRSDYKYFTDPAIGPK